MGLLAITGELIFIFLWIGTDQITKKTIAPSYTPKVSIIVPCKGISKEFNDNIKAICNQNYENYNLIFVIDSFEDPVYSTLVKLIKKNSKARLEFADDIKECSGKIAALLKGIEKAGNVDVYVFADSDIRPHRDWLRHLVSNLNNKKIGATTGYRWYFPHDLTSSLLSTWNLAGISFLFYPRLNYTWGGSTAITKKIFDDLDIKNKWKFGFSDDLLLTKAVKNAGLKIKFIPQCLVESFDDVKIRAFLSWGTTQYTWVKWYYPSIWLLSFIGLVGLKFLTLFGIVSILIGFIGSGLMMISTVLFEMIYGWLGFNICKKNMLYQEERYGSSITYALIMPIAFFFISFNFFTSLLKKNIVWKGRSYQKKDIIFNR